MHLGLEVHALDSGIMDLLLASAASQAEALNSKLDSSKAD